MVWIVNHGLLEAGEPQHSNESLGPPLGASLGPPLGASTPQASPSVLSPV
jgi:hypothetical protein